MAAFLSCDLRISKTGYPFLLRRPTYTDRTAFTLYFRPFIFTCFRPLSDVLFAPLMADFVLLAVVAVLALFVVLARDFF